MLLIWFLLVAFMITAYVVLDGFDLGVGVLHLFVARTEEERRLLMHAIGPVWDGNEVWLLAGGGTLYFAFPLLYASGFSGFYLPVMIVLWLLILRGIGIELRPHLESPVWRGIFNGSFGISSFLLIVFYGAAFGNVIRGVPLQRDGYFFAVVDRLESRPPAWHPGLVYDDRSPRGARSADATRRQLRRAQDHWRTESSLAAHRGLPLAGARRDHGNQPCGNPVRPPEPAGQLPARTHPVRHPSAGRRFTAGMRRMGAHGNERGAFLASCCYLIWMLRGAAAAVYPNLLASTAVPALNITVYNAHSGQHGLATGLIWWSFGMAIATGYFVFLYRMFRGKISIGSDQHGH